MKNYIAVVALLTAVAPQLSKPAAAIPRADLAGPIAWRVTCAKWMKPVPVSKVCVRHTYQDYRHTFQLFDDDPGVSNPARIALQNCLMMAVEAAARASPSGADAESLTWLGTATLAGENVFSQCIKSVGLAHYALLFETATHW